MLIISIVEKLLKLCFILIHNYQLKSLNVGRTQAKYSHFAKRGSRSVMSVLIAAAIVLGISLIVFVAQSFLKQWRIAGMLKNIPGPNPLPIIGNVLEFSSTTDILPALMRLQNAHGLTFKINLGPLANYVISADPELLEFVLSSNELLTKSRDYDFLHRWLGQGLLTSTQDKWRKHRKIITPTFHFKILEGFVPIFDDNVQILNETLAMNEGKEIDFYEFVILCTLDIICETAMGIKLDAQKYKNNEDYIENVRFMGKMVALRTFSAWKQFDVLYHLSSTYRKEVKSVKQMHALTNSVIKSRKEEQKNINDEDKKEKADGGFYGKRKLAFLDLLLSSDMTDEQIREEVDTFMFEGHDTITSGISFAMYNIAHHPEVQKKLQEEIDGLKSEGPLTYEILQSMKYCEMVLKESLRLYPSVQVYARRITKDVQFRSITLPKNIRFVVFAYGAHRNPDIYDDPEVFKPERFSENRTNRSPFSYLPFSAGPRNCIGQKFAMLEMKAMLFRIIEKFEVLPVHGHKLLLASETVLKSDTGIQLIFKKR